MSEIEGFAERIFLLRRSANKKQEEVGAVLGSNDYTPIEELNRYFGAVEDALDKSRALFEQVLAESEVSQLIVGVRHNEQDKNDSPTIPHTTLPEFDQAQIDRRFLTELDRLLKAKAFLTYTAWAQAIDVSPSYVAAIERGRYHFNIELLYRTVRRFPDFDFTYVLFGSALTARPEPTELPRRGRGRPKETDFRERLKKIITSYNLAEHGMWPGDHNDLANDKKVYKLYTEEYGPVEDNAKYLHEISLVIDNLINEIKNGSDKE
ncbi:MAG: XRE family transcriptional regulator [Hymenobacter sp.]|nr:MAG: XRE family transcriptional regulator [Hymenobacter sp.]